MTTSSGIGEISRVGVVGGGLMGAGIAEVCARASLDVVVVEESADGPVLCAGWLRFSRGTDFASMWGGSTLPEWRRKGLYRATVSHRARLAREWGYRFVRLDTSPDSRPILVRLGLRAVATTTPYVLDAREAGEPSQSGC